MIITRTWECPECGYEKRLSSTDATPDDCEKCGWPKPRREKQEEKIKPEEWPPL